VYVIEVEAGPQQVSSENCLLAKVVLEVPATVGFVILDSLEEVGVEWSTW
jgi:hypothetical protein